MKIRSTVTLWGVYSVWRRHLKVFQNTWIVNFLPPILEPIVYLVSFGVGLTPLIGKVNYEGQTISYLTFLAPGMIAAGALYPSFFEGSYGTFIRLRFEKIWQAMLTAPLTFTEVFLGDWLWAATRGTVVGFMTGMVAVVWGLYSFWHLVLSLPLIFLGSLLFAAIGLFTAGCVKTMDQVNIPVFLLIIPMFTFCGTYFPRNTLPPFLKTITGFFPLSAFTDLLRWSLGLPNFWLWELLWMLLCTVTFGVLAWRRIYPQLFR
ncbi:ABC transporter permease [Trichocoleus sp. FACHB-591]|uniref:ABC transporter permease n=1 Tax=Trichocoleus sp. FACHB-591 TaxID=2692872 RepID=UPI0016887680|nr:ABC transporter permease [Trichocoleus sp. FACHB-591]MBD2093760.1 ABC transporter permease [Trichocoleus sp. FACHB-591]